ncbi:glycosyltransferase [Thermocoleostomius sinensis]|uniref:Glycosyltransferase n=1 Tax=Thermocoleostomius sinensis A174 TaxID=2016057 RepID=A0A9E8ZBT7_9CYAN|nr:glycosyltransferase [Thermocoleostomius sinensis]WAL58380.1 glycosyltransferase [Thermocoleostomius sinensis A174]
MKIAFIVEGFPVLSQTFVLNQITGLIDRGHEVDIYAEVQDDSRKIHPTIEQYRLLERTYYQPLQPHDKLQRVLKALRLFVPCFLEDPDLVLRSINVFKYGKSAASLRLFYSVIPFLGNRNTYDVIQCHFGLLGIKGMMLREVGAIQGKLVTAFHGVDISQNLDLLGENLYDDLFKVGDCFLPISQHWRNRLAQLGCPSGRTFIHHMGIDCQKFTFIPRIPAPEQPIRLISIARLTEKKGIEYGIRAVAKILKRYSNIEYLIVGSGELRERLAQIIQGLGVEAQIKLIGWKNQQEVIDILNHSHILLAPSVTASDGNQEGIPVALMEAMAMGLPVISTYHSGIPELVEDDVSGFLVPERNIEALANKLEDLLQQPERWVKMGQSGRSRVEEQFNINKLNDRLVEIYQALIETGQSNLHQEHNRTDSASTNSDVFIPSTSTSL